MAPLPPELVAFVPAPAFTALVQGFHRAALRPGDVLPAHYETDHLNLTLAVTLRESLNRLGILGRDVGLVLLDEQGVRPTIGRFILQLSSLSDAAQDQLIPLLAPEFHRLAAIPDLSLPHAELVHDPVDGQIFVRANKAGLFAR